MLVVIDTREQDRFEMPCAWVRDTLETGDYSLRGHEFDVAVERKRPSELYTNCGRKRVQFEKEYRRLSTFRRAVVVIEGSMSDLLRQPKHSKVSPKTVIHTLISWWMQYGIPFVVAGNRENAQAFAFHFLRHYHQQITRHPENFLTPALEQNSDIGTGVDNGR